MLSQLQGDECWNLLKLIWSNSFTGYALVAEDGRFISVNPALCRMLEYTEAELKRKTIQEITDPEDARAEMEMNDLVARGSSETFDMTKAFLTKTKKVLPILSRVTGMRSQGKFTYFLSEMAPLNKNVETVPLSDETKRKLRAHRFWRFLKDFKPYIFAAAATIVAIGVEIFKELNR